MSLIRLDKFLADTGQGTRSEVKQKLKQGRVKVNEEIVKKPETKINPDMDKISIDGKSLHFEQFQYYMLHKPAGVVSATKDERDKTVIQLIAEDKRRDLFPVGRLDKDTEGLLVITNDGVLANNLLAPGKHVEKTYYADIEGLVTDDTVVSFMEGLDIGDEAPTLPAKLVILETDSRKNDGGKNDGGKNAVEQVGVNNGECKASENTPESKVEITITEGRYHQVKRMFRAVGMRVKYLKRISMGELKLDSELGLGEYRRLTEEEIALLKGMNTKSQ